MSNSSSSEDHRASGWIPLAVFAIILLAWAGSWLLLAERKDRGTFGDMFGAVNALFSGLALAGLVYAILLQRQDLRLQNKELALTREELAGQREQLSAQNATLKKQNFESTFFQLLRLHNDITAAIDLVDTRNKITKGRDCIGVFYSRFGKFWTKQTAQGKNESAEHLINNAYLSFFDQYHAEIGHYFRSLYNLIRFIDRSDLEDKRIYTNLVRAHLSSTELTLLFYNCLSDLGRDKFKPLVEEYSLLKTVPRTQLLDSTHVDLFAPSAFE